MNFGSDKKIGELRPSSFSRYIVLWGESNYFWVNFLTKIFQIDITSSDLNEFWIGQKIWRATPVLFLLSTGFMGVGAKYRVENPIDLLGPFYFSTKSCHSQDLGTI